MNTCVIFVIIILNFQTITAHIGIFIIKEQQIKRQPTIQTIVNTSESKKAIINNLVEAFVMV